MYHQRQTVLTKREQIVHDIDGIILDIFDMHDDMITCLRELDLLIGDLIKDIRGTTEHS